MLVLTRKIGQQIRIGDQITLTIVKTQGQTVRVGIEAPADVRILRAELPPHPQMVGDDVNEAPEATPLAETRKELSVVATASTRKQRLPGREALETPRRTTANHPHRWTVANMRERVQDQTSPRRVGAAMRSAQPV